MNKNVVRIRKSIVVLLTLCISFGCLTIGAFAEENTVHPTGLIFDSQATVAAHMNYNAPVATNLPSVVSQDTLFPTPGNQGSQGSCVGWAIGYALRSGRETLKRGWSRNAAAHKFSPSYIYNKINGGVDGGSTFSKGFDLLKDSGVCSSVYFPYNEADYTSKPDAIDKAAAALYKISSWDTICGIDEIKTQLSQGKGVVIGVRVYPDFDNISSTNQVYDTISGSSRGNHAICLIGYDNSKGSSGAFKFINSWGTSWGINGYGWISYNLVNNASVNGAGAGVAYKIEVPTTDSYKMGDVNGDGSIKSSDAQLALAYVSHTGSLTSNQYARADVNGDSLVTSTDAQLILKYAARQIDHFPLYD
jgi:C1A family cysteine protease